MTGSATGLSADKVLLDAALAEEQHAPTVRRPVGRPDAACKLAKLRRLAACQRQEPRLRRARPRGEEEQRAAVG